MLKEIKFALYTALVALAACNGGQQADSSQGFCSGITDPKSELTCIVNLLNDASQCNLLSVDADGTTAHNVKSGATINFKFVPKVIAPPDARALPSGDFYDGYETQDNNTFAVQIDTMAGDMSGIVLHELGHTLLLTFPDNVSDTYHSLDQSNIMYYLNPEYITPSNLENFIKEVNTQKVGC